MAAAEYNKGLNGIEEVGFTIENTYNLWKALAACLTLKNYNKCKRASPPLDSFILFPFGCLANGVKLSVKIM